MHEEIKHPEGGLRSFFATTKETSRMGKTRVQPDCGENDDDDDDDTTT